MSPRISIRLWGFPLDEYAQLARRCDELGFHALWVSDHLFAPLEMNSQYPYRRGGKTTLSTEIPLTDPLVMLSHLAAVTTRIRLGVGILILPLRNPITIAKTVATTQILSGGRLLFGVGTGWIREEFEAVDEPFEQRGARTDEMIDVLTGLWSGEPFEHRGQWYSFKAIRMMPPPQRVPILIGGISVAALRRAARLGDGWYAPPLELERLLRVRGALEQELDRAATSRDQFRIVVRVPPQAIDEYAAAGFSDMVLDFPPTLTTYDERVAWLDSVAHENGL